VGGDKKQREPQSVNMVFEEKPETEGGSHGKSYHI
jgi:hypothetical protein